MSPAPEARSPVPRHVPGPRGPWAPVARDLERRGTAVVWSRVAPWHPDLTAPARLRALLGDDRARYEARQGADAERFAAGRLLLKYAAARALRTEPDGIELAYGLTGRPLVRGRPGVTLSLSHTGDLLCVAVTVVGCVGVDVEDAGRRLYDTGLEPRMCAPYERAALARLPEGERDARLLRLWVLKEAYTKALAQGRLLPFTTFGFRPDGAGGGAALLRDDGTAVADPAWRFTTLPLAGTHLVGLAVRDTRQEKDHERERERDVECSDPLDRSSRKTAENLLVSDSKDSSGSTELVGKGLPPWPG
ncbi:4'-phosphopantetheinyl transferase superfamily protein [Streptomyces sp. NPDC002122]|uniref:4'-phosphopantetheinyl transferase family protein n=1 Tax=Streptomyces sp. NPDC002122 TaxID=3154407 RepID=UPI003318A539